MNNGHPCRGGQSPAERFFMNEVKDITGDGVCVGMRFGTFTVAGKKQIKTHIIWDCVCDCGRHRNYGSSAILIAQKQEPRFIRSCGFCPTSPPVEEYKTRRRIYHNWDGIKQRCMNPNCKAYKYYGARGITIHKEWWSRYCNLR